LTSEEWETRDFLRQQFDEKLSREETQLADAGQKVASLAKLLEGNEDKIVELLPKNQADWDKVAKVMKDLSDRGALPELPESMGPQMQKLIQQGTLKLAEDPKLRGQVLSQVQQLLKNRSLKVQDVRSQFDNVFAQSMRRNTARNQMKPADPSGTEPSESSTALGTGGKLKWGDVSKEIQAKFKQVVLPPGFLDDPTNKIADVTPSNRTPRSLPPSENVSPDLPTEFEPATGGEVRTRELPPRYRSIVKKYFQPESEAGPSESKPSAEPTGE
ncbi:MAG: hypothetical protein KDA84_24845, partial [Planctomycetaceae bacterium]|nr:hypothetical protein [Planctomycetaceae bacterium]